MASKTFYVIFATVTVFQAVSAQCSSSRAYASNLIGNTGLSGRNLNSIGNRRLSGSYLNSFGNNGLSGSYFYSPDNSGGDLSTTSSSALAPNGVSLVSNNAISGALNARGTMPFLAAVAFDDNLDTAGSGTVDYECGTASGVGMYNENCAGIGSAGLAGRAVLGRRGI